MLALLRECRAEDEEAARLLEAYLDRVRSNWHDEMAATRPRGGQARGGAPRTGPDVTVDEALPSVGLPRRRAEAIGRRTHR